MYHIVCSNDKESLDTGRSVISTLKSSKIKYVTQEKSKLIGGKESLKDSSSELIVVIGDDNLILKTFRDLDKKQIPVFAIASGQSFLAQASSLNYKNYFNLIKKNKFGILKRSRLIAKFDSKSSPIGLNDIGLFSSKTASLINYSVVLNDELFRRDVSDGFVTSTPTGSTGYSLSAGGPIVLDDPSVFTLTHISSIEKHSSVVISDKTSIKITDISGYKPILVVDGEVRIPLKTNSVTIEKSPYSANFLSFSKEYALESKLKSRTSRYDVDKLKDLPASAKLIYKILIEEGNMTQKGIISASLLPDRTVRYGLNLLIKKGMIRTQTHFGDARQTLYGV